MICGTSSCCVRQFASRVLEAQGIAWKFQTPPEPEKVKLTPEQRRHLFLIFKEAINNIARHAHCASVTLTMTMGDHQLWAEIVDDGCGFIPVPSPGLPDVGAHGDAPSFGNNPSGNGLNNMKLRAAQLGGHMSITSVPGCGTRLTLCLLPSAFCFLPSALPRW